MELKVVISDPETGKAYQQELKDDKAIRFKGKKVGDEISGSVFGLEGYTLKITGGSDKCGFPIKPRVHGTARPKILMESGIGYNPKRKVRRKKRVRGERIDEDIVQVNTAVLKRGRKRIDELLGAVERAEEPVEEKAVEEKVVEAKAEEPKPEEKAEKPAEAKPDEKTEEPKPEAEPKARESKPEEKPKVEKAEKEKPAEAEAKPVEEKSAKEEK